MDLTPFMEHQIKNVGQIAEGHVKMARGAILRTETMTAWTLTPDITVHLLANSVRIKSVDPAIIAIGRKIILKSI
jgi:hypothetical protein